MPGRWCTHIAGLNKCDLVLVHEACAQPVIMMTIWKVRLMSVPTRALFRCHVGLDQMCAITLHVRRFGDCQGRLYKKKSRRPPDW